MPRAFPSTSSKALLPTLVGVVLAGGCAHAPAKPSETALGPSHVVRATLKNGLRLVVVPNTLAPVATMEINYLVGSNEAPAGFPGTAHAQEHMMFRGSPGLSAGQLADIMALLGGDMDADTQQTVTQYFITAPAEDLDVALHVGAERMRGVLDTEALWGQERGAIEQEVAADLSNPGYVLYTKLLEELFAGTPYAHDALGTRPSFDQTTGAMLKNFHDAWYAPNNAVMIVAGDVDPGKVIDSVEKLYGSFQAKRLPSRPPIKLQPVVPHTLAMNTDQPTGYVALAFRLPGYDSPDFAATQILADVLDSHRGPLYALVPEGKALWAGFDAQLFPDTGLGFAYAVFPKGADTKALAADLKQALAKAVQEGFSEEMVRSMARQEATQAELQKTSVDGLAQAWSQAVAVEGRASPEDDVQAMEAVTAAEVDAVGRRVIDLGHAVEAVLTPQPSGAPVTAKGFGGAESFAPTKTEAVQLPSWAAKALSRLEVPKSSVRPVVSRLPNGLRLIVQPESASDTVSVFGRVKSQAKLETPKGQDGVARVLGRLFEFGTTSLDRVAFQKALDDIGAQENAGVDFSVQSLSAHFDRAVQLLADNELHPALPAPAFQVMRGQVADEIAGRNRSPTYLQQRALEISLVPSTDPMTRQATQASVSSVSYADLEGYYRTVFRPDLTTIVVIGKIDPATATRVVAKYFGGWKAQGPRPPTDLPAIPLSAPSRTVVPDQSRAQDRVTLAESLGLVNSNPDRYALELGNHVLGGGFYATRLYHDLRETTGLVYFVGSTFQIGKRRSFYLLSYACDPPNVSKARAIAVRDLTEMTKTPVGGAALAQAKGILLRNIPLRESSEQAIASGLLDRIDQNLPLDEPTRAAKHYLALDAKAVQAAFAHWLDPSRLAQVTQGPAPQ